MAQALPKSEFALTKDNPYLTLMDELWGACYEDFREN